MVTLGGQNKQDIFVVQGVNDILGVINNEKNINFIINRNFLF